MRDSARRFCHPDDLPLDIHGVEEVTGPVYRILAET